MQSEGGYPANETKGRTINHTNNPATINNAAIAAILLILLLNIYYPRICKKIKKMGG